MKCQVLLVAPYSKVLQLWLDQTVLQYSQPVLLRRSFHLDCAGQCTIFTPPTIEWSGAGEHLLFCLGVTKASFGHFTQVSTANKPFLLDMIIMFENYLGSGSTQILPHQEFYIPLALEIKNIYQLVKSMLTPVLLNYREFQILQQEPLQRLTNFQISAG